MGNLVKRYVYDVVRRLPENEREEVSRELEGNIYDMLPEGAGDEEIKEVLYAMGEPSALAVQYSQKPMYLISPQMYSDYLRALKWIVPMVGVICLIVGMVVGGTEAFKALEENGARFVQMVLQEGISLGFSGAFYALFWVTTGFAIADRVGKKPGKNGKSWNVDDLPDEVREGGSKKFAVSDSVAGIILAVVFGVLGVLFFSGVFPALVILRTGEGMNIINVFTPDFMKVCMVMVAVLAAAGIVEEVVKLVYRRWNAQVCAVVVACNAVGIGCWVYVMTRPEVFSTEFAGLVEQSGLSNIVLLSVFGNRVENSILIFIALVAIVLAVVGMCKAVYCTVKESAKAKGVAG